MLPLLDNIRVAQRIVEAVQHAETLDEPVEPRADDTKIDRDWFQEWRNFASKVSSEKMRSLWTNILAEEIVKPGRHNQRVLNFLSQVSRPEAAKIEKLASLVSGDRLIFDVRYRKTGDFLQLPDEDEVYPLIRRYIEKSEIVILREIGILDAEGGGYTDRFRNLKEPDQQSILPFGKTTMHFKVPAGEDTLELAFLRITNIGLRIIGLCSVAPNFDYLLDVAQKVKSISGIDCYFVGQNGQ